MLCSSAPGQCVFAHHFHQDFRFARPIAHAMLMARTIARTEYADSVGSTMRLECPTLPPIPVELGAFSPPQRRHEAMAATPRAVGPVPVAAASRSQLSRKRDVELRSSGWITETSGLSATGPPTPRKRT